MISSDAAIKKEQFESGPKASHGYGGQFGVEKGNMDKVSAPPSVQFKMFGLRLLLTYICSA